MIELVVNGTPYTNFISASATVALNTLANDFTFTSSAVSGFPALREGDSVVVLVDRQPKVTGYIDEVAGSDSEGQHTITYTGRDKSGDLIDSQIDVIDDIRPSDGFTLKKLVEIVISHLGLDLRVVDRLNAAPFNKAEDIIAPEVGQDAFEFILQYARKRQALLTTDGEGNVVITQSSPSDSGAVVQRIQGASSNNILTQAWTRKGSDRFNRYVRRGQLQPKALNFAGDSSATQVENQNGAAIDSDVRSGRQQVVVESDSYSGGQLQDRAKWAKQLAKASAISFSCSVRDHVNSAGDVWDVNRLVQVNSDKADISQKMLLNQVTFSQGEGTPTVSSLQFVEKNVYTINDRLLGQRPAGKLNNAFTLG